MAENVAAAIIKTLHGLNEKYFPNGKSKCRVIIAKPMIGCTKLPNGRKLDRNAKYFGRFLFEWNSPKYENAGPLIPAKLSKNTNYIFYFIIIRKLPYHRPTINLETINIQPVIEKLDINDIMEHKSRAVWRTLRRPQVSAKNPQKCEANAKPKFDTT